MKRSGFFITLILLVFLLFSAWCTAWGASDGYYTVTEATATWDGTEGNTLKSPTSDYDYACGDDESGAYALPWAVTFYGQTYSRITVDTNGNIWFNATAAANSFNLANTGRGPVISAWNNDLSSAFQGGVFIQHKTNPERIVIEWQTDTYTEESMNLPSSFAVVIYPDGSIRYDYSSFNTQTGDDAGSGISRGDGSASLNLTTLYGNVFTLSGRSFLFSPQSLYSVTVSKSGQGSGTVTGSPPGISCGSACIASFAKGTALTLMAVPAFGSVFDGWSGACSGAEPCAISIDNAKNVLASFSQPQSPMVAISSPSGSIATNTPTLSYNVSTGTVVVKIDGTVVNTLPGAILDALADGPHIIRVESTNSGGYQGFAESCFIVDTTPPIATGITPALTLSSTAIAADYQGTVGITISNINPAASEVLIEQLVDVNQNNVDDAGDYVIRSFKVTDGIASTNPNVQGDEDEVANSAVTSTLNYFLTCDLYHAPGHYLFRATKGTQNSVVPFTVSSVSQSLMVVGMVTDGTNPIAGAMVQLTDKWQRHLAYAVANASGIYVLNIKQPGIFNLLPVAYGYVAIPIPVTLAASQNIENHNLSLTAGTYHLSGNVRDATSGTGIAGVWIQASDGNNSGIALTNSSGVYDLLLPSGQYSVSTFAGVFGPSSFAKGYADYDRQPLTITVSGNTAASDIILPVGNITATGRVLDITGNPLPGIPVMGKIKGGLDNREPVSFGISDASGNYSIGLFGGTNWNISLDNTSDYLGTVRRDLSTTVGPLSGNDLTVHPITSWVQGVVKDSTNKLLSGVEVKLRNTDSSITASVFTAQDGAYQLGTFAGNWFINALTEINGINPVPEQSITLIDGQTATVDFVATSASTTITLADTTAPVISAFTIPTTSNSLTVNVLLLSATDNVAVTGYLLSETAPQPQSDSPAWTESVPANYTFTSQGAKTIYAFAKDAAGNISQPAIATIEVTASIAGVCGASNGQTFTAVPSTNLCKTGAASDVTGNGPWSWSCGGSNGGRPVGCSAMIQSHYVTFYVGTGGKLTGVVNQTVNYGASATSVTALPNTGYHLVNWTGTGGFVTTAKNPLTVNNVTATQAITANFAVNVEVTKPIVKAFTIPTTSTTAKITISAFTASDNIGVAGYLVTESATTPLISDSGWSATRPGSYTFTGLIPGVATAKTVYAWAKDAAGNISLARTAVTTITIPDTSRPVITEFTLPAKATLATVSITSFVTNDNGKIAGYNLTTTITAPLASATGWSATKPASYTFTGLTVNIPVSKTLYAWVKDAAGNVSLASSTTSARTIITLADTTKPVVSTFIIPTASTSARVTISALTATDNVAVTGYQVTESATAPTAADPAWNIVKPTSHTFAGLIPGVATAKTVSAWAKDAAGNVSLARTAVTTIRLPDTTKPVISEFTLSDTSKSPTVIITAFTASDNGLVSGYFLNTTSTTPLASAIDWSATKPASYTFTGIRLNIPATKTLYAWVKDAAGNVSLVKSARTTITLK